ncbi:helix-turn-helix domain-containing protein [Arthrobacter cheniae]|uniref:hypothetical protein n=1 Tax=Arthrobacter cheniae TaxID=1258888 RepID=UPI001F28F24A|nr:hypothetical protein [Arthrobacter cheniae]
MLDSTGVSYVEDRSPSGGRHLYVPLQQPIPAAEARQLIEALRYLTPSIDPSPHRNVTDGCIRVPGSAHKRGGHQMLVTPLTDAHRILTHRNPPAALTALRETLAPELHRVEREQQNRQTRAAAATLALRAPAAPDEPNSGSVGAGGRKDSVLRTVARTGIYDTSRYTSDSEARMAVLNHFAACHWTIDQVHAGMTTGQFTGLTALYGTKTDRLLTREWANAQAWTTTKGTSKALIPSTGKDHALNCYTSHPQPTPPYPAPSSRANDTPPASAASVHQLVNDLEVVLYAVFDQQLEALGRVAVSLKPLMRSILGYVRTTESTMIDVGCRSFALATGSHYATIARLLRLLEEHSSGILTRVGRGRGRNADLYAVQLPEHFEQLARALPWRKGKIYGIRPVFRVLGNVAALAYEGIERARHSPTTTELASTTRISRNTLSGHLSTMENLGMIRRHHGAWQINTTTNLRQLADRLGATDDFSTQLTRYRKERADWHAWLDRHRVPQLVKHELHDPEVDEYWLPPIEDDYELHRTVWNVAKHAA